MPLLTALADEIVALDLGRVIAQGKPSDVVHDPRVVASYLGTSEEAAARSGSLVEALPLEPEVAKGGTKTRSSTQTRRKPAASKSTRTPRGKS